MQAGHRSGVVLCTRAVSSVKIAFEDLTRSTRCGGRRHVGIECRRYACSSARSVLFIKRHIVRFAVPTRIKRCIFCLIPVSDTPHFGVVILNAVRIVITGKVVTCIGRGNRRGHCRIVSRIYGIRSVYATVFYQMLRNKYSLPILHTH